MTAVKQLYYVTAFLKIPLDMTAGNFWTYCGMALQGYGISKESVMKTFLKNGMANMLPCKKIFNDFIFSDVLRLKNCGA